MIEQEEYSRGLVLDCLIAQRAYLLQNDPVCVKDEFKTEEEYTEWLHTLTYEQLIKETETDDDFPLSEFIYAYSE